MGKIESREGTLNVSDEKIFNFLSDFRNFSEFIPADKVKNFSATSDSCLFELDGIGKFGFQILEKDPVTYIKFSSHGNSPLSIYLSVNIMKQDVNSCNVKISIETDVNPIVFAMIKSTLQNLADTMIMQMENFSDNYNQSGL